MTVHTDGKTQYPAPGVVIQVATSLRASIDGTLRQTVAALARTGGGALVLDLERLDAIDAAGVGELMAAFCAANAAGSRMRIAGPRRRVRHLLQVAGVLGILGEGSSIIQSKVLTSACGPSTGVRQPPGTCASGSCAPSLHG